MFLQQQQQQEEEEEEETTTRRQTKKGVDFLCRRFCSSRRSQRRLALLFDGGVSGVRGSPFPFRLPLSSFAKASLNRSINSAFFTLTFKRRWAKRARSSVTFSVRQYRRRGVRFLCASSSSARVGTEDDDDDEEEAYDTWGWRRPSPATGRNHHRFDVVDSSTRFPGAVFVAFDDEVVSSATRTRETWRRDLSGRRHRFISSNWSRDFFCVEVVKRDMNQRVCVKTKNDDDAEFLRDGFW